MMQNCALVNVYKTLSENNLHAESEFRKIQSCFHFGSHLSFVSCPESNDFPVVMFIELRGRVSPAWRIRDIIFWYSFGKRYFYITSLKHIFSYDCSIESYAQLNILRYLVI